jgi:hypothetical protein
MNPATVCQKYGPGLVTPGMMPSANIPLDDLPGGVAAAAAYVAAGKAAAAGKAGWTTTAAVPRESNRDAECAQI